MKEEKKLPDTSLNDRLLKTRSVILTGEITKESADYIVKALLVLDAESNDNIILYINSPGGDVDAGFAIYDTIRFIRSQVITVGLGLVASAASLVLLAVDKEFRLGLKNSSYLIHQPLTSMKGVASDILIHATHMESLRERLDTIIAKACDKTYEQVRKDTERDNFLFSEEALDYGLISKIIENIDEI